MGDVARRATGVGRSGRPLGVVYGRDGGDGHAFGEDSAFAFESWGEIEDRRKRGFWMCVLLRRAGTIVSSHVGNADWAVAVKAMKQNKENENENENGAIQAKCVDYDEEKTQKPSITPCFPGQPPP